ncbi:MAG: rhomboid family intramembrane serine protease [Thermoguttaceae bacterium]
MPLLYARDWGFLPADSVSEMLTNLGQLHVLQTMLTYAFLHAGWAHVLCNMWMLAVFGAALEVRIGSPRFAAVYVLCAVFAVLCQGLFHTGPVRPVIGASGAISGVLGCYLALEPRSRVLSLFFLGIVLFVTEVPSLFYAGVWLILQIDGIQTHFLTGPEYRNIAWCAHLGGFVAGATIGIARKALESCNPTAA